MNFFSAEKVEKIKIGQNGHKVVKMLGIDQGKRFVFCCGLQIDLWTELRAKKWSKKEGFWGPK